MAVRGAQDGRLDVLVSHCEPPAISPWSAAKELIGLPFRLASRALSLLQWSATHVLDLAPGGSVRCREAGAAALELRADRNGHLTAASSIPVDVRLPSQPYIHLWHLVEPEVLLSRDVDPGSSRPRRPT